MGLDEGRYLGREPELVLVVRLADAPPPPRRRLGRQKPRPADPDERTAIPVTTLTVIRPDDLGGATAAQGWLIDVTGDDDAIEADLGPALRLINRAVHAHRAAALDPGVADVTAASALVVRVGYGSGDGLADGAFEAAIELPRGERRRRAELLRPQERVAEVLSGRETVPACELLVIRARADLDAGRTREAALQLRAGLEAMLAEREALEAPDQEGDFAALGERREATARTAQAATSGELDEEATAELTETLRLCERVLRRKRALG